MKYHCCVSGKHPLGMLFRAATFLGKNLLEQNRTGVRMNRLSAFHKADTICKCFCFHSQSITPVYIFSRYLLTLQRLGILYYFVSNCHLNGIHYLLRSYGWVWLMCVICWIFSCWAFFYYLFHVLVATVADTYCVLLNILWREFYERKCLCMSLMIYNTAKTHTMPFCNCSIDSQFHGNSKRL